MKLLYFECLHMKDSMAATENTYQESLIYLTASLLNEIKIITRLEKLLKFPNQTKTQHEQQL